jgi:hypothetical protein
MKPSVRSLMPSFSGEILSASVKSPFSLKLVLPVALVAPPTVLAAFLVAVLRAYFSITLDFVVAMSSSFSSALVFF